MNSDIQIFQGDPVLDIYTLQNENKDQIRYSELFYQIKRMKQVLFIFKQFSLLKNKNENINNIRFPTMNLNQWRQIYQITTQLGPIISKFRKYKTFQMWHMMVRRQKIITVNFIRFLSIRKCIILRSSLSTWSRSLRLKRYYDSIPVFPGEDLKLRAFRAFVIIRLRKKRDNTNIESAQQASNYILISKTFDLWRLKSKLKRLFQYFEKRHRSNLLRSIFVSWIKNKRIHRRLTYLYDKLVEQKSKHILWKSFKKWQSKFFDNEILCKKANQLIRSVKRMKTRRLFRKWQWSIIYLHDIHEAESFVRNNSSSFSFEKCFLLWKNKFSQNIQQKKARKDQILSFFLLIKRNSLNKWKTKLNEILLKRKKIQEFHSNLYDNKFLKAFFSLWKLRYKNRHIMKLKWIKATNKWHHSLLSTFFINWHFESKASKKYSTHLLHTSILSFHKYHQHVVRIKYVLLTTYKLYQYYLKKNMLSRWRTIVIQNKKMLNLQKQFRIRVLLDAFIHGSSNKIPKRKLEIMQNKIHKDQMIDFKPVYTNDEKITELTMELNKIQEQINKNKDDLDLHKKYIQIIKQINKLQK